MDSVNLLQVLPAQWLNQGLELLRCPVCKAGVNIDSLVPVYSGTNAADPRDNAKLGSKRPQAQRMSAVLNDNYAEPGGFNVSTAYGFGMLPELFFNLVRNYCLT